MATFYVNKSGNDGNSGASRALAKLTIQGAVTASATNDTIYIGTGIWKEGPITLSSVGRVFIADGGLGSVIIDGDGTATSFISCTGASINNWQQLLVRNYTTNAIATGNGQPNFIFSNCIITNCAAGVPVGTIPVGNSQFLNCVFYANAVGLSNASTQSYLQVINCTFLSNTTAGYKVTTTGGGTITFRDNILSNSPDLILASTITDTQYKASLLGSTFNGHNYNCYHLGSGTNMLRTSTASRTTLGGVQTATAQDANSIASDPLFIDTANIPIAGTIQTTSPCIGAAHDGTTIGAYQSMFGITPSLNSTYLTNAVLTNITLDGSNFAGITAGTDGTIAYDVLDTGVNARTMKRVMPAGTYDAVDAFDKDKTDTAPNRWTLEVRASDTAFVKTDASPSWVEKEWGTVMSGVSGRYQQVRVTLRNDDVAA